MSRAGNIVSISPRYAVPGGEIYIDCEGFEVGDLGTYGCFIGGVPCKLVGASSTRIVAVVPEGVEPAHTHVHLESGGEQSGPYEIVVGARVATEMHIVANPAVDPKDDSIWFTRSGGRGQELPNTLYRLETDGYVDELPAQLKNPTGLAFDDVGDLYVTNRSDGEVLRVINGDEVQLYATHLGIATGIAFDREGAMYVGDRGGTIYRIPRPSLIETFAVLEPSVAAFHMAFGPDDNLYVTSPGLASSDRIYQIDTEGVVSPFFHGLGRPQGLAFDNDGNLYVAACNASRRGIFRIAPGGASIRQFVSGMNIVGLCFTRKGDLIAASNDSVYSIPAGVYGTLLTDE
jgi:sugar lactone lactonase YvrE